MAVTLAQARTGVYGILRELEDTPAYPYTLVDGFINSAQLRYCNGMVRNPFTGVTVTKGKLPFLSKDAYYSNIASTYLTADVAIGATTLYANTTDYPSTGTLFIAGNTIPYTGKTSTTFTGCSNVLFAHISGSEISFAYTLPTDYMSSIQIIYNNVIKLNCMNYDEIYENLKQYSAYQADYINAGITGFGISGNTTAPFYTIKDGTYLIIYNLNQNDAMIHLRYERTPDTLEDTTDTLIIPNDTYAKNIIIQMASAEMLYHRGEEQRASQIFNFVMGQIKESYRFYDNQSYETQSGIRYTISKSGRILNI